MRARGKHGNEQLECIIRIQYSMESGGARATVDLDKIILDFSIWEECTADLLKSNNQLNCELKLVQKKYCFLQEAAKASSKETTQLKECIDKLHAGLARRCDLEDENDSLKKQVAEMKESANQLEQENKKQMAEALENLQTVQESHKEEIQEVQEKTKQQMQHRIESLERSIREKSVEVKQLQKQNAELERARHTEVVKLRLEYDAKLLKLQKQTARSQCPQSSSVNNEIFRKKLQHAKAESDREINELKRTLAEMKRELEAGHPSTSTHQPQHTSKKRRIY